MSYPNFNLHDETFETDYDIHGNPIYTNEEVMNTVFGDNYDPEPPIFTNEEVSNTAQQSQSSRRPVKRTGRARAASEAEVAPSSSRKKWTKGEDKRLAICFSAASQDSVAGNDQSAEVFWNTVHSNYHTELPLGWVSTRTKKMFRQHWPALAGRCFKFATKMNACDHFVSGEQEDDKLQNALQLYYAEEGRDFEDLEAYKVLPKDPRWFMEYESKLPGGSTNRGNPRKKLRNETGGSTNSSFDTESSRAADEEEIPMTQSSAQRGRGPRPIGRNQAKANAKAGESSGELDSLAEQLRVNSLVAKEKISAVDRLNETLMTKERRKQEKRDCEIMAMNLNDPNITGEFRKYILHMQADVRARRGIE